MANHPNRGRPKLGALLSFTIGAELGKLQVRLTVGPQICTTKLVAYYDLGSPLQTQPRFADVATPEKAMRWFAEPFRGHPSRLAYWEEGYRLASPFRAPWEPEHSPL